MRKGKNVRKDVQLPMKERFNKISIFSAIIDFLLQFPGKSHGKIVEILQKHQKETLFKQNFAFKDKSLHNTGNYL